MHLNIFYYCKNIFYFCKNIFSFYKNIFYFYKNIFYFYENISDLTHGVAEPVDVALGVGAAGAGEAGVGGRRAGLHVAAARDGVGLGLVAGQTRAHRVTCHVTRAANDPSAKFYNHREGYKGLLLVE